MYKLKVVILGVVLVITATSMAHAAILNLVEGTDFSDQYNQASLGTLDMAGVHMVRGTFLVTLHRT